MEVRRGLPFDAQFISSNRGPAKSAVVYYGCTFDLDAGQPVNDILFQVNGAPVRKLDTATRDLEVFMGPPEVRAADLAAMASAFKNGPMRVEAYPVIMKLKHAPCADPETPIETRSFSISDWVDAGLVYQPKPRTYALTLAGRNAIEQFKAFPA
jgi:hypothetical protein